MTREITSVVRLIHCTTSGVIQYDPPLRVVSLKGCCHQEISNEPVGASIECPGCRDLDESMTRAAAFMESPQFSHVTERSTACNGDRSWTSYMFYRVDPTSPTKCRLEFSAPFCDEMRKLIAEHGKHACLGPSRGNFARC